MLSVLYNKEYNKVPVKLWLNGNMLEASAKNQIQNLQNLPFAFHHIAVMPDCHQGYGMPIGGVLATDRVIIPNAVGTDIGCGMCAVKTSLKAEQLDKKTLKKIRDKIIEVIPVGKGGNHSKKQDENLMSLFAEYIKIPQEKESKYESQTIIRYKNLNIVKKEYESALYQIGTLGGGNHFIEIQKDTEDNIWIMIHSGSRNLGYKVAQHYNDIAIELNERWFSSVPKEWELAFLPIESQEAKDYMAEMQYCVDFALANRKLMMERIVEVFSNEFYPNFSLCEAHKDTLDSFFDRCVINIAHNYARWENHFGKNVIVHRKGATSAKDGEIGIIPGSQGSKSYIVRGLGNPESFMSCSHGAGRKLGRKEACRQLNLEEEIKKLDEQGIIHGIRNQSNLEEAAGAYKDIDEVMNNQKDLVEILIELQPLAVIKDD